MAVGADLFSTPSATHGNFTVVAVNGEDGAREGILGTCYADLSELSLSQVPLTHCGPS